MGEVYEAEDLRLKRHVALKFLPESLLQDPQAVERFRWEAQAASALNHPNICTIYDIYIEPDRAFIVMEYLDGATLRQTIEGRPLPLPRLLDLGIETADALVAAHSQGILHRDIKPENLFVTKSGRCKVVDFGLAKLVRIQSGDESLAMDASPTIAETSYLTSSGVAMGTIPYMSPEQVRGEELDARSDIFSFGAVLYQMATGRAAFRGNTSGVIADAILNRTPDPARTYNPDVPEKLHDIIDKALEKDPRLRYQSAADLRADLVRLKRLVESGSTKSDGLPVSGLHRAQGAVTNRRQHGLAWLAAVVALALIAAGTWFYLRSRRQSLPRAEIQQFRLTANPTGNPVDGAALSPDGHYLAYSDKSGIHLKIVSSGEMQTIAAPPEWSSGTHGWFPVAWFPEGTRFVAVALKQGKPSTWSVSTLGTRQLIRDEAWAYDVSRDGQEILFATNVGYNGPGDIWIMGAGGENPRRLLAVGEDGGFPVMSFSPDGKRVLFGEMHSTALEVKLKVLDLQNGETTQLLSDADFRDAHWLSSGRIIYSMARHSTTNEIEPAMNQSFDCDLWEMELDPSTGVPSGKRRLTNWPGMNFFGFSASSDGKRLAFLRSSFEADVYVGDVGKKTRRVENVRRLTQDEHNDLPTGWTADNNSVLFFSDRNGDINVFRQALDSDTAVALTSGPEHKWAPRLTGDGQSIDYLMAKKSLFSVGPFPVKLMRIAVNGGAPRNILTATLIRDHRCARAPSTVCVFDEISEDGQTMTLSTYDPEHGRGRAITTLNPNPYINWDLSPDGSTIAMSTFNTHEGRIRLLPLSGESRPDLVIKNIPFMFSLDWTPDGKGFYVAAWNNRNPAVFYVDLDGSAQEIWAPNNLLYGQPWAIPSYDGKRVALSAGSLDSNAWMVENF